MFSIIAILLLFIGIYLILLPLLILIKQIFVKGFRLIKINAKSDLKANSFVNKHRHYLKTKKAEERLNKDWEDFHKRKTRDYETYLKWCKANKTQALIK